MFQISTRFWTSQFKLMYLTVPYVQKSHYVQKLLWPPWNEITAEVKGSSWIIIDN